MSNFDNVLEFHDKMGLATSVWPYGKNLREYYGSIIEEEFTELMDELFDPEPDKVRIAKEIVDMLYVGYSLGAALGLPIDAVFREVHRSNMSKLVDGKPMKREDGKILKGPNYKKPDLSFVA